VLSENC